jgi:RHS repeat-associated protein
LLFFDKIASRARGCARVNYSFLTQKERDIETALDYFGARYYASAQGRFTSVDPFEPILGRQGARDKDDAERQFASYLGQPQNWNRYTYCLNNPLSLVDPDGLDPVVVNLNVIFDKEKYTEEQRKAFIESYVAQAKQDFGNIEIQFNVTVTEGSASDTANHNKHKITSGVVEGAINVFVTPGSVGPSPEISNYSSGQIWLSTGGSNNTEDSGNLTHGIVHVLGIAGGVNGFTSPANTSDNRWYLMGSAIVYAVTSNDAESAAQGVQDHLRAQSLRGPSIFPPAGHYFPDARIKKRTDMLREGARRYQKK